MNTKHTPGPWSVGTLNGYNANIVYSHNEDKGVCQVYGSAINQHISELTERDAEGMANARLIAAAPELLEALDGMLQTYGGKYDGEMLPKSSSEIELIDLARAAIAKATGAA